MFPKRQHVGYTQARTLSNKHTSHASTHIDVLQSLSNVNTYNHNQATVPRLSSAHPHPHAHTTSTHIIITAILKQLSPPFILAFTLMHLADALSRMTYKMLGSFNHWIDPVYWVT